MIQPSRRTLIKNLIAFIAAAPSIVRASSLMPVKPLEQMTLSGVPIFFDDYEKLTYRETYYNGFRWWITGLDNIVHYEEWPPACITMTS